MDSKLNMSRIEVPRCGTALKALSALFRSDRFDEHDIANASATLSQKGQPVAEQTLVAQLKYMLNEWGIGFDSCIEKDSLGSSTWMYDSITFLTRNPCIIGFMVQHKDSEWRAVKRIEDTWDWQLNAMEWERVERHTIINKLMQFNCPIFLVWKQWVPLNQWVKDSRPFYVRSTDTEQSCRWEYEPTSCWMPQKMVYQGKDREIARILKKWSSPCLISNAKQFLMLAPGPSGWESEQVMEFDGLPLGTVSDRLSGLIQQQIEAHINKHPRQKKQIMPYLAHALMSVANKFGIKINHKQISAFQMDGDDVSKLRAYEEALSKIS